jgi:signal transduction histidine kinase
MHERTNNTRDRRLSILARNFLLWVSAAWTLPLLKVALGLPAVSTWARVSEVIVAVLLAPVPAWLVLRRRQAGSVVKATKAAEELAQLKLQLENVRYRTARLREELQAADRQARLSHQLTLLGQFTAGFMHEFNNPLAIVSGRLEVLLEERRDDGPLRSDLQQMLKETRYMSKIATTLLQALRRERRADVFEASDVHKALSEVLQAIQPIAEGHGVCVLVDFGDAPRVDVPDHVVSEVVRGLLNNAVDALNGGSKGVIRVRLEPYRTAGAKVVVRIEDNGPGVPESIREHLFEPFISHSSGRERLGLGLFLAASLLDMYDGRIRYEPNIGGGAAFVVELPPARFTRGQPYHWFAGEVAE